MLLLSLLIAFAVRAASVSFHTETNASIFTNPSLELRQDSIDLEDQSWVENWAAIGDSYAAGIGSGSRTHFSCSRYNLSYPALMNIDDRLGDNPNRKFTYWACSGHTIDLITNHRFLNDPRNSGQVNSLGEGSQDVITISAGGNDAEFGTILDHCIFGWTNPPTRYCDSTLRKSQLNIRTRIPAALDDLLTKAKTKLTSRGRIYITGYAQFFNSETTQCNGVSWNYWYDSRSYWQYLTQQRRRTFNNLVIMLNHEIELAVQRANAGSGTHQVVFVKIDGTYLKYGGLFCEPDAAEPAPDREASLMFNRKTKDRAIAVVASSTEKDELVAPGTFEGQIASWISETLTEHPNWRDSVEDGNFAAVTPADTQAFEGYDIGPAGISTQGLSWYFPDSVKRVFHPQPQGHAVIANRVFEEMRSQRAIMLGIDTSAENHVVTSCELDFSHPSKYPTCQGNSGPTIPARLKDPGSGRIMDINSLIFELRQGSCTNACSLPPDLAGGVLSRWQNADKTACELAIALPNGAEAWTYRSTPSTGVEWQDCWDSFSNITEQCVKNGANNGWVNGPDDYQYYQAGIRPINDPSGAHSTTDPLDPDFTLLPA
ncbi:hypothetical protein EG327_007646 [Venturia inaequalis]|uniref:SGNH hydrolase-type esterase domain-containing protein n=2 Tax=Venturia inaequalis TaxID=5025 RepID=A0A8H3UYG2_VENIN|nr:hypothetical protein EG327_007646 [Venturia inaequalis]